MNLLRSFPVMSFAVVMLAIVGQCVAQQSMGMLLLAGTLASLSWYVTEGPRAHTLPRWVARVLIFAALLNAFREVIGMPSDIIGALGRFVIWLTLVKLYERRDLENEAQRLVLSLLLVVVGCLYSIDLLFGLILFVWVMLGIYVLLLFQLRHAEETMAAERSLLTARAQRLSPSLSAVVGRKGVRKFRWFTAFSALVLLLSSAVVFFGFPRQISGALAQSEIGALGISITGLDSKIDLTRGSVLLESRDLALTVAITDENGVPWQSDEPIRLRAGALSEYDPNNGVWRSLAQGTHQIRTRPGRPTRLFLEREATGPRVRQEFKLQSPLDQMLSMGVADTITTEVPYSLTTSPPTDTVEVSTSGQSLSTYVVEATLEAAGGSPNFRPARPYVNAAVKELAQRLLAQAGLPTERPAGATGWAFSRDAAMVFTNHLLGGGFEYTTDLRDVSTTDENGEFIDPVEHFLLTFQRGHCEYYASAVTAMCHTVDVNARIVTGFYADTYDESSLQYLVLQADAHAWVEVETEPGRWEVFDATPEANEDSGDGGPVSFADRIRWAYQWWEGGWRTRVLGYDGLSQRDFYAALVTPWTDSASNMAGAVAEWARQLNRRFGGGGGGYLWLGLVALAIVLAVLSVVKIVRRSATVRRSTGLTGTHGSEARRLVRAVAFYVDMLDLLRRTGTVKPGWQPPGLFAESLDETRPQAAPIVREITDTFYEVRYGARESDQALRQAMDTRLKDLAAALGARR